MREGIVLKICVLLVSLVKYDIEKYKYLEISFLKVIKTRIWIN